jgi:hypothetical protein
MLRKNTSQPFASMLSKCPEKSLPATQKYCSLEKTLVPSLQCFQSDPFGARGRGILTPSGL